MRLLACCSILGNIASASISVDMDFGVLRDNAGTPIDINHTNPALQSAMWVLIYDQNDDGMLPGGLETTVAPPDTTGRSLVAADSATAHDAFNDELLALDSIIEGDKVIAIGDSDPNFLGFVSMTLDVLDFPSSGLTPGRQYGFYWFPGVSSGSKLPTGSFQVGGITEIIDHTGNIGTEIPDDGSSLLGGVLDSNFGGTLPTTRFLAITAESPNYSNWIAGFPNVGAEDDFGDDPDGDGLENGVEAVLGSRPDTAGPGLTMVTKDSNLSAQSTQAKPMLSDVTATWQWSSDLANWHDSGVSNGSETVTVTESVTDDSNPYFDITEVTAEVTVGTLDRLFIRLQASEIPPN